MIFSLKQNFVLKQLYEIGPWWVATQENLKEDLTFLAIQSRILWNSRLLENVGHIICKLKIVNKREKECDFG